MNRFLNREHRAKPLILLIDDDPRILRQLESDFDDDDRFETISSESPLVGIELAKQHRPDLVILDIIMPMYDGGDVERMIRKCPATRDLPIIMRSSLIGDSDLNESGYLISAGDVMTAKSSPFPVLLRLVERILDGEDLLLSNQMSEIRLGRAIAG